jgi:hypothetical protein
VPGGVVPWFVNRAIVGTVDIDDEKPADLR